MGGWIAIVIVPFFAWTTTIIWHRRRSLSSQQLAQPSSTTEFETSWKNETLQEQSLWTGIQNYQRHPTLPILTFVNEDGTGLGDPATMAEIGRRFVPRPTTDVHIVTYPKAGTSWIQEVAWLVNHDADIATSNDVPSSQRTVYIELRTTDNDKLSQLENVPIESPRHIKWHHSSDLLPEQIVSDSKSKIIYLLRNPKDTVVSWYHFQKKIALYGFTGDFDAFFELFLQGNVAYGCYMHNVRSWWKLRHRPNVLILTYEDMHADLSTVVQKVATFLGKDIMPQQVTAIVEHCQFQQMKDNPMTSNMRKGQVGDWRNYLSEDQSRRMDIWVDEHEQQDVGSDERLPLTYE